MVAQAEGVVVRAEHRGRSQRRPVHKRWRRVRLSQTKFRTPDLGGILGDTVGGIAEGVAESEVGAGEGGIGGVEVRE